MNDKILIVIPYFAREAQGRELELALHGWRQHFQEPHCIVIVGDKTGIDEQLYDVFIDCPRIKPVEGQYTPHLDHVHKFRKVHSAFPKSKGFVYTCDDIYPIADFTLEDIKRSRVNRILRPRKDWTRETGWNKDLYKTEALCRYNRLPSIDWVCHLPVYYEWDKLLDIYDTYDCGHESYVVENIYFGMYGCPPKIYPRLGIQSLPEKYEVKTSSPGIRSTEETKATWITNANCGWSLELEAILKKHYNI